MTSLRHDAEVMLTTWRPLSAEQLQLRDAYCAFIAQHDDALSRTCRIGHLTASALVMSEDRQRVLLTLHPKVGRWLQLGGHIELGDDSVRGAARREVIEECGLQPTWLSAMPVRLDRHAVPCGGSRSEHLDVQFLALVDPQAAVQISDESLDLRWFPVAELPIDIDASVQALVADAARVTRT